MSGVLTVAVLKAAWDWLSPVVGLVVADMVSRHLRRRRASRHEFRY